jgi:hypothetical protein
MIDKNKYAFLILQCRNRAKDAFFTNMWLRKPLPYIEIEIDNSGNLYRYVQGKGIRINVDKEKKKHAKDN